MPDKYRHALIIGKFLPLHKGHLALARFAREHCARLTVLVGALPGEPIPGPVRHEWVKTELSYDPGITVDYTDEELPSAPDSDRGVSRVWAAYLKKRYPDADLVVSSERYGDYLAEYMGIRHISFDMARKNHPVSGTAVRNNPLAHWDDLPVSVRPWYLKRVCVYGPESTGKTTLCEKLAACFKTEWVPEMARIYIGDRKPKAEDIPVVAELHAGEILKREKTADRLLIVDSDLITTRIYSSFYFGFVPTVPEWVEKANRYDLYLLSDIDTPWVEDIQRDTGHMRERMMNWFRTELELRCLPYRTIRGNWEERLQNAVRIIREEFPGL